GVAIIPDLRAYGDNKVSIDPTALPIDSTLANDVKHVVPGFRGAVVAAFDAMPTHGGTLVVPLPDGTLLPHGIPVDINDRAGAAISGCDGVVYLDELGGGDTVAIAWDGGRCGFKVPEKLPDGPLPDLGKYVCSPIGQ